MCVGGGNSLAGVQEVHELQDRKEKMNEQRQSGGEEGGRGQNEQSHRK